MSALQLAPKFSLPLDVVTEALAIVATRGAGKSSASAVIVEEAFVSGVQVVIFDRTGVYWGLRSAASGSKDGLSIYVLGGPHADVPLEPNAGAFIADLVVDSGHSFVLDLSDFSKSAAIRFAADFLERLYDRKARARTTTLLVIDEAHFYAPQSPRGGFKGDAAKLMGALEDAVGLGRSRGLGVILTTQRTQALNKAILDMIETLIVMRMLSPRARKAVQEWIQEKHEDDEQGVIGTLDSLPTGSAWVWSPLRGILERIAIRRIQTFDSYKTPAPGEQAIEPTARTELDLDALGEQMRATVERAKADDPVELRKRIRELERQLEQPAEPAEPTEVLVPYFPEGVLEALSESDFDELVASLRDGVTAVGDMWNAYVDRVRAEAAKVPKIELSPGMLPAHVGPLPWRDKSARPVSEPPAERASHAPATTRNPAARSSSPGPVAQTNGRLPDAQQRVLNALAWWQAAGVTQVSRLQLAMVADYHPRTNAFTGALAELSDEGKIVFPRPGHVELRPSGSALADHPVTVPSSDRELQQMIMGRFSDVRRDILATVLERGPISRTELAEVLGMHPRTNSFTGAIGSLKSLGLIDFPRAGWVEASSAMVLR